MNMHDHDATEAPLLSLLMGVSVTARSLGISERALWALTNSGDIPHVRIGRRVMYRPESLRQWLSAREQRGVGGELDAAEHRD